MKFDAPIPGSSLTKEPGNSPWEQPPLYSSQEEVLGFYFKKFNDEDFIDDTMFLLERKMPLEVFVDSLTSVGVMEGYHSIDAKMLVAPQIHEYLKMLAETLDVSYVEFGGPSKEEKMKEKDKRRMKLLIEETLNSDMPDEAPAEPIEPIEDLAMPAEAPVEAPVPTEQTSPPAGLIPRRA